jgi:hypothetical protein
MSLTGLPAVVVDAVAPLHAQLAAHRVYDVVSTPDRLARFMGRHVYAVWDFMSLLKRLQRDLTVVDVPWRPERDPMMARLINEIVLAEESDLIDGRPISHFALYREAMLEVGAATTDIDAFVATIAAARDERALDEALSHIPNEGCRTFVVSTLQTARFGSTLEVAASFLLGREDIIPAMFARLRAELPTSEPPRSFIAYLERHIHVDADEHGPAAARLLLRLIGTDPAAATTVARAATRACQARLALWDAIATELDEDGHGHDDGSMARRRSTASRATLGAWVSVTPG